MEKLFVYFGTWGAYEHPGKGKGIYIAEFDQNTGEMEYQGENLDVPDCGIICASPDGKYIYAANELSRYPTMDEDGLGGAITALRIDPQNDSLQIINRQPSLGSMPNYVCTACDGQAVLAVNHGTFGVSTTYSKNEHGRYEVSRCYDRTNIVVFPAEDNGYIKEACYLEYFDEVGSAHIYGHSYEKIDYGYNGKCPVSPFHLQGASHLHSVAADQEGWVIICNRGADKVYLYEIFPPSKEIVRRFTYSCRFGTGPRHVVFHPVLPYFYIVNEIESSVMVFKLDKLEKKFDLIQTISTLPSGENYTNMPSDIKVHPSGKYVYCSNRYHNSISAFKVSYETGKLVFMQNKKLPGGAPRGFNIEPQGNFLVVGLSDDDQAVSYRIDEEGQLTDTGFRFSVPTPTCVLFVTVCDR